MLEVMSEELNQAEGRIDNDNNKILIDDKA